MARGSVKAESKAPVMSPPDGATTRVEATARSTMSRNGGFISRLRKRWLITILGAAVCLAGAVLANRLWRIGYISNDAAYFAHAHRLTGEGLHPYDDYFVLHGPVTFWIAGLFTRVFDTPVGLWIIGSLITLLLMASCAWVAVCAVGRDFDAAPAERDPTRLLRYVAAAAIAAGMAAGWGRVIAFIPVGGRPKFLAVALLMVAIGTLARRRYFVTGALLALACWTWQVAAFQTVGVLLTWTALMIVRRREGSSRNALSILSGGLVVGVICVAVLLVQGVWGEFVTQTFQFPLRYAVDPWEARGVPKPTGLRRLIMPIDMGFSMRAIPPLLAIVAAGGIVATLVVLARERRQGRAEVTIDFRWGIFALFISSYVQVLFVSHGPGYAVPLLAPAGAMAGWVIGSFVSVRRWSKWLIAGAASVTAIVLIVQTARPAGFPTMAEQRAAAAPVVELLGDEEALIVGDATLRALVGGYPHEFDMQWVYGRYHFIEAEYPGGAEAYARALIAKRPSIVYISERAILLEPPLLQAMDTDYARVDGVEWSGRPVYRRVVE